MYLFFIKIEGMPQQRAKLTLEDIFLHKKFEAETLVPFPETLPESAKEIIEKFLGHAIDANHCYWNTDKTCLLFKNHIEPIYRRSTKEHVFILQTVTATIRSVHSEKVMHATFSPDGKKIAYVLDNNLFVFFWEEKNTVQVTDDGQWNNIINGNCDWVYEEEFGFSQAFQWSPNSEMLAFYRFDESRVKEYSFPIYDDAYNQTYTYKYPKAGEQNSEVEIRCFHIEKQQTTRFSTVSNGGYIPKIAWSPENKLNIFHLNRHQNELNIWQHDPLSPLREIFYSEKNERYIDLTGDWHFLSENQLIFTSEKSGFRNIYWQKTDKTEIALTKNVFELRQIVTVDPKNGWIYFTAAFPNPMENQLFVVDFNGKQKQLSEKSGWNEAHFHQILDKIVIENSNIRTPTTAEQFQIILDNGAQLPQLQYEKTVLDNTELNKKLSQYALSQPIFTQIPTTENKYINAWMLLPADFDENRQYPVLCCNYGGPGSQMVLDKYGTIATWQHFFSQQGFILVCADNTGTGGRGQDFKKKTYLQLGKLEIEDQILTAQHIAQLPYVDADRIGHFGWSFGGFMSCLAVTKGAPIFQYAIAVAPVTSWKYYDTIYTERYMRTPDENPEGYAQNAPFAYLDNMKGKLLLIHGSADDNVHLQHSMQLSKQLIEQKIPFEMAVYSDKNHRINGGNTPFHLWEKISEWLLKNS